MHSVLTLYNYVRETFESSQLECLDDPGFSPSESELILEAILHMLATKCCEEIMYGGWDY